MPCKKFWQKYNIKNLGEYHDMYLKKDVLLVSDIFQNFRRLCMQYYNLDCIHLVTSPGLTWQTCLKMTGQTLELLTGYDIDLKIERGIKSGISMITQTFISQQQIFIKL